MISNRADFGIRGAQKEFLGDVRRSLGCNWDYIAELVRVHPRTVRDWAREKYRMPHDAVLVLSQQSATVLPETLRSVTWTDHLSSIASNGGKSRYKKYGSIGIDPKYREKKWREWWEQRGRFKVHPILAKRLPITKPSLSKELAELVGIILGDGGLSERQLVITLHAYDDKDYGHHVADLIFRLFGVVPKIYRSRSFPVNDITVSRTDLVDFCVQKLGLKRGNKIRQQVDIPKWIKSRLDFQVACLRGLVDTDGCVIVHRYKVRGKLYIYKKLAFTSHSKRLRLSVYKIMSRLKLKPRLAGEYDVRLESRDSMRRYFELVGSSNQKHLRRYLG
jgi:hypothetical protein